MFSDSGMMKTLQETPGMFQELFSNPELMRGIMSIVPGAKDFLQVIHPF